MSSNGSDLTERLNCELCGVEHIHRNDIDTHLKGRQHRLKSRKVVKLDVFREDQIKTKKNKKYNQNERKTALSTVATYTSNTRILKIRPSRPSLVLQQDFQKYELFREKYKSVFTKINEDFESYVCSLAAYYSVTLALDDEVQEFKLSVYENKWYHFGQIALEIVGKNGSYSVYVIQCKSILNTKKQIESFVHGKFNLGKQFEKLQKVANTANFIIFTTGYKSKICKTEVECKRKALAKWIVQDVETIKISFEPNKNKKLDILNTTDDEENIIALSCNYNIPKICLFQNQKKLKHFEKMINNKLATKLDGSPKIYSEYVKYIRNWIQGECGGNFKLTKRVVVLRIGEILLKPYTMKPEHISKFQHFNDFSLWNELLMNVDVVMVDQTEPLAVAKMCLACNDTVENQFDSVVDYLAKTIDTKKFVDKTTVKKDKTIIKIRTYLFETRAYKWSCKHNLGIPLSIAYSICWKAGLVPLLLEAKDRAELHFVLKVIEIIKPTNSDKSYIVKGVTRNHRRIAAMFDSLTIFTSLDDIASNIERYNEFFFRKILARTKINIEDKDRPPLDLSTIFETDTHFLKYVTPVVFLDMLLGKYCLKQMVKNGEQQASAEDTWNITLPPEKVIEFVNIENEQSRWLHGINPEWL